MDDTKPYPEDLNSPCLELSNGGLGLVVALLVCPGINFRVFLLGVESRCTRLKNYKDIERQLEALEGMQKGRNTPKWVKMTKLSFPPPPTVASNPLVLDNINFACPC